MSDVPRFIPRNLRDDGMINVSEYPPGGRREYVRAEDYDALASRLDEVSKELAATKGGPISCEAHGWSGDDECAYCQVTDAAAGRAYAEGVAEAAMERWEAAEERAKALESRLDKMSKHVLDLCEILRDKWTVDMEDSVIRISEYEAKTGLDWPPPELRVVERHEPK